MMLRRFLFLLGVWASNALASGQALSLKEVLNATDCFFPQIMMAQEAVEKSRGAYLSSKGQFDPSLNGYERSTPSGGYQNNYIDGRVDLPTLYHGLKLFTGYRIGRGDFEIWDQYYLTNADGEYRAGLDLPLFRNNAIDPQRARLFSEKERVHVAEMQKQNIRLQSYQKAIILYWAWVDAGLKVRVYRSLLDLAKERQQAVEKRVREGDEAAITITENRQFIVQRQRMLNQAELNFRQAAINLSLFYRTREGRPRIAGMNQLPSLDYLNQQVYKNKSSRTKRDQIGLHPSLMALDSIQKINHLYLKLAENELQPLLNLRAYASKDNGWGNPRKNPTAARISLNFKVPVYQREAKGKIVQAEADIRRLEVEKQWMFEQLIQGFDRLNLSRQYVRRQFQLSKEQTALALKIQQAEQKRFKAGGSSLFLVNQWEQNALQAQVKLIDDISHYLEQYTLLNYYVFVNQH